MLKMIYVDTHGNKLISEAIQKIAFENGIFWGDGGKDINTEKQYLFFNTRYLMHSNKEEPPQYKKVSIEEFIEAIENSGTKTTSIGGYKIKVSKKEIKVGCTKIDAATLTWLKDRFKTMKWQIGDKTIVFNPKLTNSIEVLNSAGVRDAVFSYIDVYNFFDFIEKVEKNGV